MLEANGRIKPLRLLVRPPCRSGPMKMKKRITHDRRPQPGVAVFRPDLHRLRLRQGQGSPGNRIGVDAASAATKAPVPRAWRGAEAVRMNRSDAGRPHAAIASAKNR